jgi:hypothetical protein
MIKMTDILVGYKKVRLLDEIKSEIDGRERIIIGKIISCLVDGIKKTESANCDIYIDEYGSTINKINAYLDIVPQEITNEGDKRSVLSYLVSKKNSLELLHALVQQVNEVIMEI